MRRPLLPSLAALSTFALLMAPTARAQEDADVTESVDMGISPTNLNINIRVKDGSRPEPRAAAGADAKAHLELTSSKPGEAFKLTYDSVENGATSFKVLAPEGFLVRISQNGLQVASDTIPMSFSAQRGAFYRFEVQSRGGVVFDKKFEAKDGMVGTLWVRAEAAPSPANVTVVVQAPAAAPEPRGGACLESADFEAIKEAIEGESFSEQKVAVLGSAVGQRGLCTAQVIEALALYSFSKDKLEALRLMKPHIVDPQNHFKILGAFTFDKDKKDAKAILGG